MTSAVRSVEEDLNLLVEEAMHKRSFEGKNGIDTLYEAMDNQARERAGLFDGRRGRRPTASTYFWQ